jgi:Phage integrase, N-terminal SAM-like domain/Phage integrase family
MSMCASVSRSITGHGAGGGTANEPARRKLSCNKVEGRARGRGATGVDPIGNRSCLSLHMRAAVCAIPHSHTGADVCCGLFEGWADGTTFAARPGAPAGCRRRSTCQTGPQRCYRNDAYRPGVALVPPQASGSPPKLLDRVRAAVRTRHYSRRTEEPYVGRIRRYIVFHRKTHPAQMGACEISQFLTWLAVQRRVSASTQNQALSAVLFLYKEVMAVEIGAVPAVVRARTPDRLPVVLSREEIAAILKRLTGTMRLVVMLLYGSGVRLEECLDLRIKDLDFDRHQIIVRQGRGRRIGRRCCRRRQRRA